jgi:outer membrane protein
MHLSKKAGIGVLCAVVSIAWAELKIGFIDSEQIFLSYEGTKEAQTKLDKEKAKVEQQASDMQKEIYELKEKLEKQSLLLSTERKKEIEDKLQQRMTEYQQFVYKNIGENGELIKKNMELTKPIVEKINQIVFKIAKDENFDLILDKRAGVVFAKDAFDLTQRVVGILNKEKE